MFRQADSLSQFLSGFLAGLMLGVWAMIVAGNHRRRDSGH